MKKCILTIAIVTLIGCNKIEQNNHTGETFMRSYVPQYYSANDVSFEIAHYESYGVYTYDLGIIISADDASDTYSYCSIGTAKIKYDAVCTQNGDVGYNRYVADSLLLLWGDVGLFDTNFTNISVIADQDYDASHLAGSELNDLMTVYTHSPRTYIESGYRAVSATITDAYTTPYYHNGFSISSLTSAIYWGDLKILGDGHTYELMRLLLPDRGQLPNGTKLTVTLTADDGRVFSDTVQVSWEP